MSKLGGMAKMPFADIQPMMRTEGVSYRIRLLLALFGGCLFWTSFNLAFGVPEPWDHERFGAAYLVLLVLIAALAWRSGRGGWRIGAIAMWSMLAVMLAGGAIGPLIAVGLLFLFLLSIPAAVVGELSGRLFRPISAGNGEGT